MIILSKRKQSGRFIGCVMASGYHGSTFSTDDFLFRFSTLKSFSHALITPN